MTESDPRLREYLADVSHEFRTPLAAIQGFAETLLAGGLDDARNRRAFVRSIIAHSTRLATLVEGLLDLDALERRALALRLEDAALGPLSRRVARDLQPLARRAGVRVRVEVPDALSARADASHLSRVLVNLLANAIAYNRRGGRVTICAEARDGMAVVSVSDTGIGIAPEQVERVFQRFHRAARGKKAGSRGSGLGLAICRGIVEAHGGRIWAESVPDRGSTFRFCVPLARVPAAA